MQLNGSTYQYDANGNMTHDGRRGLDLSWNHLNLPSSICSDEDALVNYTYLADGTKVITQQPAAGEGYAYLGSAIYKRVNNVWTLESVPFTGGRFIANATGGMDEYRYITDHLGSTRVIVTGTDYHEVEHDDYYPFGKRIADNSLPTTQNNRWRFSGKEIQTLGGIGLVDFGARMYDEDAVKWESQDPMTENYLGLTPYGYCAGNPVTIIDPDGREVRGITKKDAQNFRDDIYRVLSDDKFASIRALIDIKGKVFKSIDAGKLSFAIEGLTLTEDESAYVTIITGVINSTSIYIVEYVSGSYTSSEGAKAFVNHMNKELGEGNGDRMVTPDGKLSSAWIRSSGDGLNVPTKKGSHSFISGELQGSERAVTSGHEVIGHGIPAAKKLSPAENNANAVRTDNLIRRIMGLPQRDGSDHGGYKEGHINNPYSLPIVK